MDKFMVFYLLPMLIVMFIFIQVIKKDTGRKVAEFYPADWVAIYILSILYPVGLLFLLIEYIPIISSWVWQQLIKERGIGK